MRQPHTTVMPNNYIIFHVIQNNVKIVAQKIKGLAQSHTATQQYSCSQEACPHCTILLASFQKTCDSDRGPGKHTLCQ